ncbi:hypothetical protein HOL34_00895 [bacterium]|jgi:hypothetical protein|nr:hypothetical protein [bacterium]MBT3903861.1 hypothetical protein [bacterium]MBT4578005.1 hypothetical protein [bacterium]MBT5346210.1 hypothetical protein [bacterium]MBT6131006.1 hypothetical protein [bacterium]
MKKQLFVALLMATGLIVNAQALTYKRMSWGYPSYDGGFSQEVHPQSFGMEATRAQGIESNFDDYHGYQDWSKYEKFADELTRSQGCGSCNSKCSSCNKYESCKR